MSNFILDVDSYKFSHHAQYPPKTTRMFCYLESRGGMYQKTLFFGLQYILKKQFSRPVTLADVEEAATFAQAHGVPFNKEGWTGIVNDHGGYLPIKIRAVPEGLVIPTHNVLMTVESTDPKYFWLPSFVETQLLRVWFGTTVASLSWHVKQMIRGYLNESCENPEQELPFKLHDFGARGVSSQESALIGGMSHIVNFMGSDTVIGINGAMEYYPGAPMPAYSIPAMEHSTVISWGKDHEADAFSNMLKQFAGPGKIVACVSDSYDLYNAVEHIWGEQLKSQVIESGATVVIRPDSGNPEEVVVNCLKLLDSKFGSTRTKNSYKLLNNVRVIQGDGIDNEDVIRGIIKKSMDAGFSAANIAFGMGGGLLQKINRDTQRFAYKVSEVTVNGERVGTQKTPKTDPTKASKAGTLDLVQNYNGYKTVQGTEVSGSVMKTVYEDGELLTEYTFDEVRKNSNL